MSRYNKYPAAAVRGWELCAVQGYQDIMAALEKEYKNSGKKDYRIVMDTYPGVCDEELLAAMELLRPDNVILMKPVFKTEALLTEQLRYHLTDDRVFGRMYYGEIEDLMDPEKLEQVRVQAGQGTYLHLRVWRSAGGKAGLPGVSGYGAMGDPAALSEGNAELQLFQYG